MRKWIIFWLLSCPFILMGQTNSTFGILPKLVLSKKINNSEGITFTSETRQGFYNNFNNPKFSSNNILSDFALYYSNRIDPDYSLNFGYLIRFRKEEVFHRLIQQFNMIQRLEDARLGHRIGIDQTFANNQNTVYRLRYRSVYEKSFSGQRVDAKEFYIKMGTELLYSFSADANQFEFRILPMFGYELAKHRKLEFGLDTRAKALFSEQVGFEHWWRLTAYLGI